VEWGVSLTPGCGKKVRHHSVAGTVRGKNGCPTQKKERIFRSNPPETYHEKRRDKEESRKRRRWRKSYFRKTVVGRQNGKEKRIASTQEPRHKK